jgi:hypothetical protein
MHTGCLHTQAVSVHGDIVILMFMYCSPGAELEVFRQDSALDFAQQYIRQVL